MYIPSLRLYFDWIVYGPKLDLIMSKDRDKIELICYKLEVCLNIISSNWFSK